MNTTTQHGLSIGISRVEDNFFMTFKAVGTLTHQDYMMITPMIDNALQGIKTPHIKAIVDLSEFEGWEPRAAWDDFKIGLHYGFSFEKIAIVGNHSLLVEYSLKVTSWFLHESVQEFPNYQEALDWINK